MAYQIEDIERKDGVVENVYVRASPESIKTLSTDLFQHLQNSDIDKSFGMIRGGTSRPMIKTTQGDKVYMRKADKTDIRIRLNLADEDVTDHILDFLGYSGEDADQEYRERRETDREEEETGRRSGGEEPPEEDLTVTIEPPYTKDEANYRFQGQGENPQFNCEDCLHYVEGGKCQMVKGDIVPKGHCEDLYADIGVYGRIYDGMFETNLIGWGDKFRERYRQVRLKDITDSIKNSIKERL